jgi:hypothetical protein
MRPMTEAELDAAHEVALAVRSALSALRLSRCQDEDVRVAMARLEEWLTENDGRWVK